MVELEKDIERKLRRMVEKRRGLCLKWVCPGWSGVPDRIVLLPGGRIYFVELKRPNGSRVAKLQEKWKDWLTELGFWVLHIYNEGDLATFELAIQEDMKH